MKKVEILAPAGGMEALKAAVSANCDAVYFAGKSFGARSYALNFDEEELKVAIDYCHLYNVKVFITVNTVIFENELNNVIKYLDFLYLNQVDGVIVQDLGLATIIKTRYPGLRLHASTQINAQTVEDVKVLKKIGFDRVILGREVSLDEIKRIRENVDIELEVFAHGALCISYSGGCFISSFLRERSGNRGKCSQLCRMEYSFNGRRKYYLSPKDLCTINSIKEISKYVDSIKIEGRMKSKEYVYATVSSYYKALNNDLSKEQIDELIYQMKIPFNRGYTKGFILNTTNTGLTNVKKANHQGVLVGKVVNSYNKEATIELYEDLFINDSIRFTIGDEEVDAVIVNNMYVNHVLTKLARKNTLVNLKTHNDIKISSSVYLTKREEIESYPERKIEINGLIEPLEKGIKVTVFKDEIKISKEIEAEYSDKDFTSRIIEQLNKTKDTPFIFKEIKGNVNNKFIQLSIINEARRNLLSELKELLTKKYNRTINDKDTILDKNNDYSIDIKPNIVIYDSRLLDKSDINLDFDYTLFNRNKDENYRFIPRVSHEIIKNKPCIFTNLGNLNQINSSYCNVTNSYTVRLLESLGVKIVTLSVELSKEQIENLTLGYYERYKEYPSLALMIFGHIELMLMRHCFVNKEKGYLNMGCGECKKNILLDDNFPLYGDIECQLAILSRDVLNLTKFKDELKKMNISYFIYDLTKVSNEELNNINDSAGYYGHYLKSI